MRGFNIRPIRWLANGYGYQSFSLPPTRAGSVCMKNSHVKVWRRTYSQKDGKGREFVCRKDTAREAMAYIRSIAPKAPKKVKPAPKIDARNQQYEYAMLGIDTPHSLTIRTTGRARLGASA